MIHDLKVWPEFYRDLAANRKKFEVRKDDRGFKVGDTLVLREWITPDPRSLTRFAPHYSGRSIVRFVTYILRGPAFGVAKGWVVMSLAPVRGSGMNGGPRRR